jgi:hypothetical protein
MLIVLAICGTAISALAIVVSSLRRAPEGYEDEHGFHMLRQRASGSAVVRAAKHKKDVGVGSLQKVRASR